MMMRHLNVKAVSSPPESWFPVLQIQSVIGAGIFKYFWSWLDNLSPTGGSKLEKSVNYARNHKDSLMNYLLDGRCEISNNAAERKAKVYATVRKNFLL